MAKKQAEVKKAVKKTVVKKPAAKKPAVKKTPVSKAVAAKTVDPREANIRKLAASTVLDDFVTATNGCWDHQGWLNLVGSLRGQGYDPIDMDQVGLLLEDKKAKFWARK